MTLKASSCGGASSPAVLAPIRIDKWLWQARFFKSRSAAAEMVAAGRLRLDGTPVDKPAKLVKSGDVLTFPQAGRIRVVRVLAMGERRGPAAEAQSLYEDLAPLASAGAAD